MKPLPTELTTKLMDAADAASSGIGIDMSIDDLAKTSEVPRATLYYYFSGKDDLVQFYVGEMMRRGNEVVAGALASGGSPTERLAGVMRAMLDNFAVYPRICVEMSASIKFLQNYGPVMAEIERGTVAPIVAVMSEGNESGEFDIKDPVAAALSIMGSLHMIATMDIVRDGSLDAEARAATLIPLFMQGMAAR
jgi:TetR/AcrR family transcriptional regulator